MTDEARMLDNIRRQRKLCDRCSGTGNQMLSIYQKCEACDGTGRKDYTVKKPRYKLCPELTDGDHWVPCDRLSDVIEAITSWASEFGDQDGEEFTVGVIMMSDQEVDWLPEI